MTDEHAQHHHVNYFVIFVALCVLTGLSVLTDVVDINNYLVLVVIVMAVAAAKALCVMMFFMHLKFEGRWKYVLLTPTVILACGIPLALLPDIGVHYYPVDVPQLRTISASTEEGPIEKEVRPQHEDGHGH